MSTASGATGGTAADTRDVDPAVAAESARARAGETAAPSILASYGPRTPSDGCREQEARWPAIPEEIEAFHHENRELDGTRAALEDQREG